jgi:hypothetical protein
MKFTAGNTLPNIAKPMMKPANWKSIQAQYVSLACGVALAVSAVFALSGTGSHDLSVGRVARPLAAAHAIGHGSSQAEVAFYVWRTRPRGTGSDPLKSTLSGCAMTTPCPNQSVR